MLCSNLRSSRSSIFCTNSVLPGFTPTWGFFRFVFLFCFFLVVLVCFFFLNVLVSLLIMTAKSPHSTVILCSTHVPINMLLAHMTQTYMMGHCFFCVQQMRPTTASSGGISHTMLSLDPCRNCSGKVMNPLYQLKACYRHPYYQQQPRAVTAHRASCSLCPHKEKTEHFLQSC